MANLVPIFEREIEIRKETAFPHSLWVACEELWQEGEHDGPSTLYREALIAISDASGKKEIGKEHVATALEWARGRANRVMINSKYAIYEGQGADPELDERDRRHTEAVIRRVVGEVLEEMCAENPSTDKGNQS